MKIKELETRTGIKKTNIRYYEREGLMTPHRNDENNYRDYSEEDKILLEKIKMLRMLGFFIANINLIVIYVQNIFLFCISWMGPNSYSVTKF